MNGNLFAAYTYMPSVGDKFHYKIIYSPAKKYAATFIYDVLNKVPTFHWKNGTENPIWGTWNESKTSGLNILNDLEDTSFLRNSNLIYLNPVLFKKIKSGKNFKLIIKGEELEFIGIKSSDYNLPITGAGLKFKAISASTKNKKWVITILDNVSFPLITSLSGEVSWQLQSIVPVPMFPITQNLMGEKIGSKKADMFNSYIKETCVMVEVKYTENFRKVVFNEFFCPTVGIRFSLKNDTIVSLQLVSNTNQSDGYTWQTYRGYVLGIYGIGSKKEAIEKQFGKPISNYDDKNYYPDKGFYLIYNSKGELEKVEYE